ncbi:MAG: ParA family protein, partial [Chloroflexales bacterium]
MELVIFSALEGLQARAEALRDLAVLAPSRLDQVHRLLSGERPPDALYLDDSRGVPLPDLWRSAAIAQQAGARVLLNLYGPARAALNDAQSAGIAAVSLADADGVAAWIGAQLGLDTTGGPQRLPVVAVGAAKGGIGKTFATCVLAEGLRRRGLRVLVWDRDI